MSKGQRSRIAPIARWRRTRFSVGFLVVAALAHLAAGTGPGEFFLDVSGLRALRATLEDASLRADLRARSRVLALRAIWGSLEPAADDDCAPFLDGGEEAPQHFRLRLDFAPSRARSSRVYRTEYTCCRIADESYISRFVASGFRRGIEADGADGTERIVLRDWESIEILHAALGEAAVFEALLELATGADGIRYLEIRATNCGASDGDLEYLLVASATQPEKWSSQTPIAAFSVRYDSQSGEIGFEAIESDVLQELLEG